MSKPPHRERGRPVDQARPNPQPQQTVAVVGQQWSGPLPSPADLERFNAIIPNGAERILAMAEKEQNHRVEYLAKGLQATTAEARRGQFLGAAISLAAICGAIYAIYVSAFWPIPLALVGVPVLGIIIAIVRPRK